MYESFFKFRTKPFDLLPDPKFIFLSKSHKKALTYLDYGIRERSGFILLTGEVGSGKTTLIRDLLAKHYERAVLSKIFNTRVTSEQLVAMINDDFGLVTQGKDKVTLIHDLNSFLVEQYALGNQPILIIDEAQNLATDLLEEVRMLSNLEASDSKLLQIILVGQPELRQTLSSPELRQLRQRININCHLQALNRAEVEQYILHRLEVAGNASAVSFSSESLDAIFNYSRGIPRLINIICDFLLLSAFADEVNCISVDMVQDVVGDLDFDNYYWSSNTGGDVRSLTPFDSASSSSVADNQALSDDILGKISDISRRIESLENSIVAPLQAALKEQNDRFASLQTAISSHVKLTNSQMQDMNNRIEELQQSQHTGGQPDSTDTSKVSFVRRVFGGGAFSK
jgi:putative secretion ATPase (PEP-CTERM system associated)